MRSWFCLSILVALLVSSSALEVRVLTGLGLRGQANQPDYGEQKLVINSNGRYLYPSQQTPEYNVYSMYIAHY